MATFTKLKEGWGLRGGKDELVEGREVTVEKKNGQTTRVVCGKVIWSSDDEDVALALISGGNGNGNGKRKQSRKRKQETGERTAGVACPHCGAEIELGLRMTVTGKYRVTGGA